MRESEGVLGILYRDIKREEETALKYFKRFDYDKSINLFYNLDQTVIDYTRQNPGLLRHLSPIYELITKPMELRLKNLVIEMNLCSEAELFASNLQFKVFQMPTNDIY